MRAIIIVISCLLFSFQARSQGNVLSFEDFIAQVLKHHPVARQAQIKEDYGQAMLSKSKGAFDPKVVGSIHQKYFKGDEYYNMVNLGLKVPTWYGVSFKGGYDNSSGAQLNPERSTPDEGLWYAGIEVSLGRGLLIDKRRAEMKKAGIYAQSSIQERRLMLNNLILEAGTAYWDWYKAYNMLMVYQKAITNAQERFDNVKSGAILGDKPFADTLKANVQLQLQQFNYMDAELNLLNAQSLLEIYLWQDGYIPLELDSNLQAPSFATTTSTAPDPELYLKIDSLKSYHPELLNAAYKIELEKVDVKLAAENIKPELNFKYNAINSAEFGNPGENYSINNYVWGAQFCMPIFLRKERNQLRLSKLKLEHQQLDLEFKSEQISYKIDAALRDWQTSANQINLWSKTTQNYEQLLINETQLFNVGESSMFIVNTRQQAFIKAQTTLIETIIRNQKAGLKTEYILGILN